MSVMTYKNKGCYIWRHLKSVRFDVDWLWFLIVSSSILIYGWDSSISIYGWQHKLYIFFKLMYPSVGFDVLNTYFHTKAVDVKEAMP